MLFIEHRSTTVQKTHEVVVDVHVTFDGLDSNEFEVEQVDLVEPSGGIGIRVPSHWEDD